MELSLLVHTFDSYSRYWEGCSAGWMKYGSGIKKYFGSDVPGHPINPIFDPIYSGRGEWSDRLLMLLSKIPTKYILYVQEDHWPVSAPPEMMQMMWYMDKFKLYRLQMAPINQFYSLTGSTLPLFFHNTSKYLVSHQPSIWDREFFISCLRPGETPWVNEYEGTKRLSQDSRIAGKIAIYPCDWFAHKCVKGIFQD